ncbi:hypothetical protein C2G38_2143834 [Gigaspora rosea]|uniref:Peptidase S1 domain-containing protein n=1 Tax=Gigaspora rosea TaxID=44941 RepID=A0A397V1J2_9GLOM|nr:hypothetical protein C2G38_2143834 [Gigaspora rosea]
MKAIYLLIILLLSLQSYSIYALQTHPLAKLWKVNDTEVPILLEFEKNLTAIDDILRPILEEDEFISSFGGTYIDQIEDKLYLVVNTVNESKVDQLLKLPKINPYEDFLYFFKTNNSMSRMKYNFDKIAAITQSFKPKDVLIYIDMSLNNVVVYLFNALYFNNTKYINAVDPFNPSIIYEYTPSVPQNLLRPQHDARFLNIRILGGDGLYIKNKNNDSDNWLCSAGFWTSDRYNPNKKYIIIAGHCVENNFDHAMVFFQPWNSTQPYVSYIGSSVYNPINFYDIGIIHVENEDFFPIPAIKNTDADQYKELIIIDGIPVFSHGVHICKSGRTSHFTCGYVQGLNGIYSTGDRFALEIIITSTDVKGGDSGGPVLSFVSPQDLFLVVVHGIVINRGSSAQSIDTIFHVIKENTGLDLTLYQQVH